LEAKVRDFINDEEVRELVRAFEEATIPPSQFHHCAHIAVALTYLSEQPLDDATLHPASWGQCLSRNSDAFLDEVA
jgi:hypothetical protein